MLYEAVSEGRRHAGMEHWLPLFHKQMETLFDYLDGKPVAIEPLAEEAAHERLAQIADYYQARKEALDQSGGGAPYKPLPPDRLYLAEAEWHARLRKSALARLTPFAAPEARGRHRYRRARRPQFCRRARHARRQCVRGGDASTSMRCKPPASASLIALWSEGSRERMAHVLAEHGLSISRRSRHGRQALALPRPQVALAVLGIESGFETADVALISEQDILGERLVRARRQPSAPRISSPR